MMTELLYLILAGVVILAMCAVPALAVAGSIWLADLIRPTDSVGWDELVTHFQDNPEGPKERL